MELKVFDSELKIMEIVWEMEPVSAKEISKIALERFGWNKNTSYTVIKKLIDKGAIKRGEPDFICTSLIKKEDVRKAETKSLIDKLYNGSRKAFFASFASETLTDEEAAALKSLIEKRD